MFNIPFSTTEQAVPGVTWIDGEQVYQITVQTDLSGVLPNTASLIVNHGVADIDYVIAHLAYALDDATGATLPLGNVSQSALANNVRTNVSRTQVIISTGSDRTAFETHAVTFWYTKT